jgi:hypothetical protein
LAAARGEADEIAQLVQTADFTPLTSAGVPATEVLNLSRGRLKLGGDGTGPIDRDKGLDEASITYA